jgi:hypothetical protein
VFRDKTTQEGRDAGDSEKNHFIPSSPGSLSAIGCHCLAVIAKVRGKQVEEKVVNDRINSWRFTGVK